MYIISKDSNNEFLILYNPEDSEVLASLRLKDLVNSYIHNDDFQALFDEAKSNTGLSIGYKDIILEY